MMHDLISIPIKALSLSPGSPTQKPQNSNCEFKFRVKFKVQEQGKCISLLSLMIT